MKRILMNVGCLISFAFISSNVFAMTRANTATFTLGGDYMFFANKRHIDNTAVPYGILGYNFTEHWGIEGLLGVINTNSQKNINGNKNEHVHGGLFLVDGLYHFTAYKNIEPFVLAGVGITGLDPNGEDARNEGNINAGAGVLWFANEIVALRLEVRDIFTIVGGKNDVMLGGGVTFTF